MIFRFGPQDLANSALFSEQSAHCANKEPMRKEQTQKILYTRVCNAWYHAAFPVGAAPWLVLHGCAIQTGDEGRRTKVGSETG